MRTGILVLFAAGLWCAVCPAPEGAAQELTEQEALDFRPDIEAGREVITIESGKLKLETDLINREMESVLQERRPEWNEKPALLTSDERVPRDLLKEYRRKKKELEKQFAEEEEALDRAGPANLQAPSDILDFEGLTRTRPRVYSKEPLSIRERKERARKEDALLQKALDRLGSEEGRLRILVEREPLKSLQAKLAETSTQIKKLKAALALGAKEPGPLWRELGEAYLKSQHDQEALTGSQRLLLIRHAEISGTILGSYELAAWALTEAVAHQPNDRALHLLLSGTYQKLKDEATALQHANYAEALADAQPR